MKSYWRWLIPLSLIAGAVLRFVTVGDMEYKEDEEYNFLQSQLTGEWPWVGMPSGVYLRNPGGSVWVFSALARVFGLTTPTSLCTGVRAFAYLGICMTLVFAFRFLKDAHEREPWLWAFALGMVNPFAVLYQRKLWPQPFLPFFTMVMLMGWWKRARFWPAFVWGLMGAWIGQIHMSGFFFAAAFFLWTLFFERRLKPGGRTHWTGWIAGSALGALPLIPWAHHILTQPAGGSVTSPLHMALELKYWVFWITGPTGLHLGNPIGLLRGQSTFAQISDFIRYPLIGGAPTYLVGVAHLIALLAVFWIFGRALVRGVQGAREGGLLEAWIGSSSQTAFARNAALWGCGILLTLASVNIRRYYMSVTYPLEFVWLAGLALAALHRDQLGNRLALSRPLLLLWIGQLGMSAGFVYYVHVNQGALEGDYGKAYHVVMKERALALTPAK